MAHPLASAHSPSGLRLLLGLLLVLLTTAAASPPQHDTAQAPETTSAAAGSLTPGLRRAYAELLKLRVEPARQLLQEEAKRAPGSAGTLLVADCIDFTELMIRQDASRYEAVVAAQDRRLAQLEKSREAGPLPAYARAEIRLHQAAAQVTYQHEIQGAWSLRQAYQQMQAVVKAYPDFLPARKTLGMCQFMIGSVPEGYRWFLKLLGLPGSVEAGVQNLRRAAQQPHDFQPEARIILALVQETYFKQGEESARLVQQLATQQPDNLLYSYLLLSLNKRLHRTDAALAAYRSRPTGAGYLPIPYLHHMAADLLLYQGQYAASGRANQQFLQDYPGVHYRKDAAFKLYLAAWLSGDDKTAERYRQQINQGGRTVVEEDAYAQRFFEGQLPLNRTLTRARLQIDGGYYRPALATLRGFSAATGPLRDRLEEPYRRARAYHGLGRLDSARLYYTRTIALAGKAPYYFGPQSALQMGYLCQADGQLNMARLYFQKALDSPKHEYKNSTDAKAKVALAGLPR
ncbi:tetratricopeptide repeat protein [Hymenobacter chitinivorans]|uniref:Tetratricopeptide repeat protein n=1 Tax=Hymenobacter chitinivorans DSM 11115 TaxID=1121954 RepID=A0A2M9BRP0_9BACT|nr:DUF3808 domain-containing protein [Hymenobacter chitinivorans]PJJ60624.1 hypothetical protein CLV45_2053 [Hymenobacter chitinivorans DSM 11115]